MIDSIRRLGRVGISEDLAVSIILYLRKWENRGDLQVNPDDHISHVYGIVEEDLDDFVLLVADEIGRKPPESTAYWLRPVVTVLDLAEFVSTFPPKD